MTRQFDLRNIAATPTVAREQEATSKRILFETADICVLFVQEPAGSIHEPARHAVDELIVRLAGASTFQIGAASLRLERNGVLHVPAFVEHSSTVDSDSDVTEIVVLSRNQFAGSFFS
jgi:mannose-6-phosphate isomerase-like protein (cupin superfamily)